MRISLAGAPIAQLDRALVYGTKGCRFNSCWARHFSVSQTRDKERGRSENLPRYLTTGVVPNGNYLTLTVANEPAMACPPPESVPSTQMPVIFPLTVSFVTAFFTVIFDDPLIKRTALLDEPI